MFVSWSPPDDWSYAYLLGWYLGDGWLSPKGQLVIVCDTSYPGAHRGLPRRDHPHEPAQACRHSPAPRIHDCVRIECSWQGWFEALPQHGRGRKHERPIVLEPWQEAIVEAHPWQFLRGLLHSDGCRTINRFKTKLPSGRVREYEYPRWFFSNMSADIRGLFCKTCEQLGLRWTQSNHRNISISHRHSVALLEEHVGPKT